MIAHLGIHRPAQRSPRRRPLSRLLMVVAGLVAAGAAATGTAYAVANGDPVAEGQYRFAVRLTMPDITRPDGTHYSSACSAALIARQYIVSAGHCFHDGARNRINGPVRYPVVATIGTANLGSGNGIVVNVTEVWQASDRDLAVAKLDRRVMDVEPLRISRTAPKVGDVVAMAGWGWTGEPGSTPAPSSQLYTGTFTVTSVASTTAGTTARSPEPDTSACDWDSGAPYFVVDRKTAYLVSVESDGPTCPHSQEETTARADNIRGWIAGITG